MFNKIIESEIKWCETNDGAMPAEFRKGFVAGLKQAVYLINAATQRMVWKDGEMIDDADLLERVAEHVSDICNKSASGDHLWQLDSDGKYCIACGKRR